MCYENVKHIILYAPALPNIHTTNMLCLQFKYAAVDDFDGYNGGKQLGERRL